MKCLLIWFFGVVVGMVIIKSNLINGQLIRDNFHFRKTVKKDGLALDDGRTMVLLSFGQSNAANYGEDVYVCKNKEVYNFYRGSLYRAEEPLLGADGKGSSVWTRVADRVIDGGLYDKVIIVPVGIGQTPISCWAEGRCRTKLDEVIGELKSSGISLTHVCWVQGETDNVDGTTRAVYKRHLTTIVEAFRNQGVFAPLFVALTSYFPYNNDNPLGIDPDVRGAQQEVIAAADNVFEGPDLDALNLAYYRYDAVHFSENGLDALAKAWCDVFDLQQDKEKY